MILKKLLADIIENLGFATRQQIEVALSRQREMFERMDQEQAAGMGISGFLMKPLAIRDLSVSVRQALDKSMPASEH